MNGNGASERDDGTPDQAGSAAPHRGARQVPADGPTGPRRRQGALLGGLTLGVAVILVAATVFVGSGGPGPTPSPAAGHAEPSPAPAAPDATLNEQASRAR